MTETSISLRRAQTLATTAADGMARSEPETDRDEAVAQLYETHWLGMVRLAGLMLGDRPSAEDVVQDSFAELYRRWDKVRDRSKVVTYLRSTVLNRSRNVIRRRQLALRRKPLYEPPVWSAESEAVLGEDRREVLVALNKLPARRREVLILRYFVDLSDAQIAQTLGIAEGTVRSAAHHGLATLAKILKGESR
ncbi:RNA polymerase sigma factor [Tenggerimyces flavus]|uniref:RNA polymerase sigma factor n=1 Tax=Tenggerimyces flavus TaxID=1708749 RepID=A0ABV7YQB8_9ACTN|nr:SigE family RNA polymerase sigma factor [Tenggerimyces flavus]MBM7786277.1 RNA polymerase sigma-70 factor (sigma-E family) [Tenggerimyces flavus]